jgi:hypothetical protein
MTDDLDRLADQLADIGRRQALLDGERIMVKERLRALVGDGSRPTRPSGANGVRRNSRAEGDERVLALLREGPKRQAELVRATTLSRSSIGSKLAKLRESNLAAPDESGLWSLTPPASP